MPGEKKPDHCLITPEALLKIDPSPKQRYLRWLEKIAPSLTTEEDKARARTCLAEFHGVKHRMEVEERDINRYPALDELNAALAKYRRDRARPSKLYLSVLDEKMIIDETAISQVDGLVLLKARSIEDVITLAQNEDLFSFRGQGLYEALIGIGDVYIFISGAGVHIGAKPTRPGEKGVLFDCFGEQAVFEEILACHPDLNWDNAEVILTVMTQIDPCLPFDMEFENVEPFIIALEQFELVLMEDRSIPEHLVSSLSQVNSSWVSM